MEIKEVEQRFHKVKEDLKKKFKEKGMSEDQIKIEFNRYRISYRTLG